MWSKREKKNLLKREFVSLPLTTETKHLLIALLLSSPPVTVSLFSLLLHFTTAAEATAYHSQKHPGDAIKQTLTVSEDSKASNQLSPSPSLLPQVSATQAFVCVHQST